MSEGNYEVILCERGVRTFADHARNTLGPEHCACTASCEPLAPSLSTRAMAPAGATACCLWPGQRWPEERMASWWKFTIIPRRRWMDRSPSPAQFATMMAGDRANSAYRRPQPDACACAGDSEQVSRSERVKCGPRTVGDERGTRISGEIDQEPDSFLCSLPAGTLALLGCRPHDFPHTCELLASMLT